MHLKKLTSPKTWKIKRKQNTWITRPNPGAHNIQHSVSLSFIIRDLLNIAKTSKEVKKILRSGKITVNGIIRNDPKYPVGLFDIIEDNNSKHILYLDKNSHITSKEINIGSRPLKITNKSILKKGKIQLNFNDGSNKLADKDSYNVGDTLILDIKTKTISDHLKMEKGATVYILGGKNKGLSAKIKDINGDKITLIKDEKIFDTVKERIMIINEDFDITK